jgi:hypothetical protein
MIFIDSEHGCCIHEKMNMKENYMNNENTAIESLSQESVKTLVLMSELAQEPDRSLAIKELRKRGITRTKELLADAFMLLL